MLYWLDTEFLDDGKTIDLISIGIVAEDGRELYACNLDARLDLAAKNSWMRENVLAKLPPFGDKLWMHAQGTWQYPGIREAVLSFMFDARHMSDLLEPGRPLGPPLDGKKPKIWGYYSSYDWVVFCQLFGPMVDLPKQLPKRCGDLRQLADDFGNPKFAKPDGAEAHNALTDARWNRDFYEFLMELKRHHIIKIEESG